jgi:hypothetical protein
MSMEDNLRDLERHARDFADRRGFTYSVLATDTGDVIGCVYISRRGGAARANGVRRLNRVCVRTAPSLTRCCTAHPAPGSNASGRSSQPSMHRGLPRGARVVLA